MERAQILKVLVPVAAVAALLLAIGVVVALTSGNGDTPSTDPAKPHAPPRDQPVGSTSKFAFALDGPEWKDIGGGLKIWDVKEGSGAECPRGATVKAQYTGWRPDGFSFDNPQKHGANPIEFSLNRVVRGWQEGIPGMKVGGVRRLFIPSALGYGGEAKGSDIPPNTDLIFEVELAEIR